MADLDAVVCKLHFTGCGEWGGGGGGGGGEQVLIAYREKSCGVKHM